MHGHRTYHVWRYISTPPYGFEVWCSHTATTSTPLPYYSYNPLYASFRIKQHSVHKTPPPNPCWVRWIQSTTSHPTPSHLALIWMLSYNICPFMRFDAPNNCPSPRSWVKFTNTLAVWYDKQLLSPAQPPNWSTTPSRLSLTAYFLYLQLAPNINCLHTQCLTIFYANFT